MCPVFKFKQFSINDDGCAMKVNTDGVLLGAWVNITCSNRILDIGTGSGLIALILAQRSDAKIDAIDIHQQSADAATINAANSPWPDQIRILHISLNKYTQTTKEKYDHIVSNPPFFESSLKSPYSEKNIAKHVDELTCSELIESAKKLLLPEGKLSVILPNDRSPGFKLEAEVQGLSCTKISTVKGKADRATNRMLLEFSYKKIQGPPEKDEIIIRDSNGEFASRYQKLTAAYYLNF